MKEYWTSEVEEAFAKYVRCEDKNEKNEIYIKHLHIPFKKLIDVVVAQYLPHNIIYNDETRNDLLYF